LPPSWRPRSRESLERETLLPRRPGAVGRSGEPGNRLLVEAVIVAGTTNGGASARNIDVLSEALQLPIRGRLFINFMIEKLSGLDL
jgi:hypothetical protein